MVFTTKPKLALPGHIHRTGGLYGVAFFIFGGHDQLNLPCLIEFGLAEQ